MLPGSDETPGTPELPVYSAGRGCPALPDFLRATQQCRVATGRMGGPTPT